MWLLKILNNNYNYLISSIKIFASHSVSTRSSLLPLSWQQVDGAGLWRDCDWLNELHLATTNATLVVGSCYWRRRTWSSHEPRTECGLWMWMGFTVKVAHTAWLTGWLTDWHWLRSLTGWQRLLAVWGGCGRGIGCRMLATIAHILHMAKP